MVFVAYSGGLLVFGFSRPYLSNGRAIVVVVRLSLCPSICPFVMDVLWLSFRSYRLGKTFYRYN